MKIFTSLFLSLVVFVLFSGSVMASHSWGNYHWARTANPFTLKLGDNVPAAWDSVLATSASDWSASSVLNTAVEPGLTKPRTCKAFNGKVQVCADKYGFNGWLGIAQIWINGDHIVKGIVKANDSYFNTPTYNTTAWRNLVMCQEIGHTLGLDHVDENFDNANQGTCMDYTSDPSTNQHPNAHDYEQLEVIYAHLDSVSTVSGVFTKPGNRFDLLGRDLAEEITNDPTGWGEKVKEDASGNASLYRKSLGGDWKLFTFVIWTN